MANNRDDANIIEAAVIGGGTSAIATGLVVIETLRYRTLVPDIPRAPYVNRDQERESYINSILYASDKHCIGQIRMSPLSFLTLCETLTEKGLVQSTIHMSVREQVMIFLHMVAHNVRFRVIGSRFYRSTETVHRYFLIVLNAILKLYPDLVKLPSTSTPSEIRRNRRFYPWFADCVGAIDGTHIRASVPLELQARFRGRKGMTSQNVLAAITFDLKFVYVLAGWEGSAHDSRVLDDAVSRPRGLQVPEGKYYLADSGYGIRSGFIPPYRGTRYHLKEYSDCEPENKKELFNLRHSSLRCTVERGFGVLKKRFRVLGAEPYWKYEIQVDVVLACCVLHNLIMRVDPNDRIMRRFNRRFQPRQRDDAQQTHSDDVPQTQRDDAPQTQREEREESREWGRKRDAIADAMYLQYLNRRNA